MQNTAICYGGGRGAALAFVFLLVVGCSNTKVNQSTPLLPANPARWTMINVSAKGVQGDAHLFEFGTAKILVDSGFKGSGAADYLVSQNITYLDSLVVSHAHSDHYGGIGDILKAGISIGVVYMYLPTEEVCKEEHWGCKQVDLDTLSNSLKRKNITIKTPAPGDLVYSVGGRVIKTLYAYDGVNTPIGPTDLNDTSVIMLMQAGNSRGLLTGDLNSHMGNYLATNGNELRADILKVPHHGTDTLAPNSFFDAVSPKLALVPAPLSLWQSDRSARCRSYFEGKNIPTYVNGRDGHIFIDFSDTGYVIQDSTP